MDSFEVIDQGKAYTVRFFAGNFDWFDASDEPVFWDDVDVTSRGSFKTKRQRPPHLDMLWWALAKVIKPPVDLSRLD